MMEDSKMDATADNGRVCGYGYCRPFAQILRSAQDFAYPPDVVRNCGRRAENIKDKNKLN